MKIKLLFIFILFLVFKFSYLSAQDLNYKLSDDSLVNKFASYKRVYYAARTELKPKIDGKLDDECWQKVGTWDGAFIQQQPYQAKPPSQETEIKILYDDKYLYIAIICHDNEPEKMSPILGRRDDYGIGDITGVALDTYDDNRTAFEFNLTSAGQKIDVMHMGEYGWDTNWNAVWDGKTSLGDSAWFAEMRVPFTQLRYSNAEEHIWGMHIWRYIYRLKEESQWKLIPVDAPAMVYIFGDLRGIKDIPNKKNFEIMPYLKGKYISNSENSTPLGVGLDGKIGLTSNMTLDYTFNPDFGQVEADPSVLNLTSYETFYEEKRPFFMEGNSILEYNTDKDMLYYSRRIGHAPGYTPSLEDSATMEMPESSTIINALKLTGKNKKGLSLGIVNSMTSRETARVTLGETSNDVAVEPFTNYFIGRLKQELNNGNTSIGGIVTSAIRSIKDSQLEFLPDNSTVAGLDFENNWLNRKYFVNAKAFYSKINGNAKAISKLQRSAVHLYQRDDAEHIDFNPELTSMEGWGGHFGGGKKGGKFRLATDVEWRSPGVDLNDVGYLRQADFIREGINLVYNVNKPKWIFNNYYFSVDQRHHWSYGGENTMDELDNHGKLRFKNLWVLDLDLDYTFNTFDTRQLRGGPALRIDNNTSAQIFLQSNSSKKLSVAAGADHTWFTDRISWSNQFDFVVLWNVTNSFSLSSHTSYLDERFNSQYVKQVLIEDKKEYVVGKINRQTIYTTLRIEYFITPELSLQYYGSPYASTGKYTDYRKVNNAKALDLEKRYSSLIIEEEGDNQILVDEDGNVMLDFSTENPDFDYQEFNSNFVLRWEYKTGSTLYFVWTNTRSNYESEYNPSVFDSIKKIVDLKPQNAFMLKLSYWFSL